MTITAKFHGTCKRCRGPLPAGTLIDWSRDTGATHTTTAQCDAARLDMHTRQSDVPAPVTRNATPIAEFLKGAQSRGLKFPKVRFLPPPTRGREMRLSIAGPASKAPGAINVVIDEQWIGRIETAGTVIGPLASDTAVLDLLDTIATDPATAARAYGAMTSCCSFCDKDLSDAGSVEVGYGPICARRYGLPHKPQGTPQFITEWGRPNEDAHAGR